PPEVKPVADNPVVDNPVAVDTVAVEPAAVIVAFVRIKWLCRFGEATTAVAVSASKSEKME
ncbi:MAG: hypothetical protein Q9175_006013, partial [Cornicularia normoerica]